MSMFQQRHYETIARMMQGAHPGTDGSTHGIIQWEMTRDHMTDMFRMDNSRFTPERFMAACEPGANVKLRTRYKLVG